MTFDRSFNYSRLKIYLYDSIVEIHNDLRDLKLAWSISFKCVPAESEEILVTSVGQPTARNLDEASVV